MEEKIKLNCEIFSSKEAENNKMLNLIVITTLAQFIPVYEEEFNLTLPENIDNITTTLEPTTFIDNLTTSTLEPTIFIDDSSGDFEPIPKKGKKAKKMKKAKTASFSSNLSFSSEEESPDTVAANVFIAGTVGMVCIALLAGIYSISKRRRGYQMINSNRSVNTYGTVADGSW